MQTMQTLFISHGAPTLALEDSPTGRFLDGLSARLSRPDAVIVISAHDSALPARVGGHAHPPTVHDFAGFPRELYALQYPAPGHPDLAARVLAALDQAGIPARLDPLHGIDHGVWVPMRRIWPDATVPVVTLSLSARADAHSHLRIGAALHPLLATENLLLIGSGGLTHNLNRLDWNAPREAITDQTAAFREAITQALEAGDIDALAEWETRFPFAREMHPTIEHLLPLHAAFGAAGPGARGQRIHGAVEFGCLTLDAWRFQPGP